MTAAAEHTVDRTGWAPGPWDTEPDRIEWRSHGMPALMVRNHVGAWCGYVGLAPGHPAHGKGYDEVDVEAHGGLTYAARCAGHICHVPRDGESDEVWWLGFDTAHSWDYVPSLARYMLTLYPDPTGITTYRDVAYVRAEVERLAEQLAAMVKA